MIHPTDRLAYDRAMVAQPVWNRFTTGAEIGVAKDTLLHAGPPFSSPDQVTRPILNSACVAAVYEGLARDFDQAEAMVLAGEIRLKPAQDFGVVTPLADRVAYDRASGEPIPNWLRHHCAVIGQPVRRMRHAGGMTQVSLK